MFIMFSKILITSLRQQIYNSFVTSFNGILSYGYRIWNKNWFQDRR